MLSSVAFTVFLCGTATATVAILARFATFAAGHCRWFIYTAQKIIMSDGPIKSIIIIYERFKQRLSS